MQNTPSPRPAYDPTDPNLTNKTTQRREILDLFTYPPLHRIGRAIDEKREEARAACGRRSPYSSAELLLMVVATRSAGSLLGAVRLLDDETWRAGVASMREDFRATFRTTAPSRDDVQYFRDVLEKFPELRELMQSLFQRYSVRQAQHLGNLLPGTEPDASRPLKCHTIYGDGTIVRPYSDVTIHLGPDGKPFTKGSKTTPDRARVQRVESDLREDRKTQRGINFVAIHTWTRHGRVTLATGSALGAEVWTALELVEQVKAIAGDGIHTLLYDRVFIGWLTEYLMAAHRMEVVNKAAARASTPETHNVTDRAIAEQAERLAAEYSSEHVSRELLDHYRRLLKKGLLEDGAPLPVGASLYESSSSREVDLVASQNHYLEPHQHEVSQGTCTHRLVVDDGGLYVIGHDDELGCDVKVATPVCSQASTTRNGSSWERSSTWVLPCREGDTELVLHWAPSATRFHAGDGLVRPTSNPMTQLRPVHRGHDNFGAIANHRNDAESYNAWLKQSLRHGRASTLSLAQQELDFLAAGMLCNSITLHRS